MAGERGGPAAAGGRVQPVKDQARPKDSEFLAGEAPWRESRTVEPSDNMLKKEFARDSSPRFFDEVMGQNPAES